MFVVMFPFTLLLCCLVTRHLNWRRIGTFSEGVVNIDYKISHKQPAYANCNLRINIKHPLGSVKEFVFAKYVVSL